MPLPGSLVVKNGSKILDRISFVDPAAGVADGQHHVSARRHGLVSGGMARVQLGVGGLDAQQSPVGHGVPGVHAEVHHHLLQLPRVGLHLAEVRAGNDREVDVFADQASEHLLEVRQEGVEVQHLRVHDLLPAEGQELAGEAGGALRGLQDLLELAPLRLARLAHQELGVPQDDAQRVVEVVGDAPGQAADRLHLLRLQQLRLEAPVLGDVLEGHSHAVAGQREDLDREDPLFGAFTIPARTSPRSRPSPERTTSRYWRGRSVSSMCGNASSMPFPRTSSVRTPSEWAAAGLVEISLKLRRSSRSWRRQTFSPTCMFRKTSA